jgi:phosphoribosylglycinamide formyltransferase, formyltetrahydrofolate-dependent
MVNVAIFASGSGTNFENLVSKDYVYANICLLVVDKENAYAINRAIKLGVPYVYVNPKAFASKKEYEEKIVEYLKAYEIDVIALAGYMRFIGEVLLHTYPNKIINLHPAYLPAFPGAHSIMDAYIAKAKYSGVTLHYVDEGIDTGKIVYQEKLWIDQAWSFEEFEAKIHELEYQLFPDVLERVCKEVEYVKSTY